MLFQKRESLLKNTYKNQYKLDKDKNTLLHLSIIFDKIEKSKQILKQNDFSEVKNTYGFTSKDLAKYLDKRKFFNSLKIKKTPPDGIYRQKENIIEKISIENFEKEYGFSFLDNLIFKNEKILKYSAKKSRKILLNDVYRKTNNWTLEICKNRKNFSIFDYTYIKFINSIVGFGVFARKDIPELTYLGEYSGIVRKRNSKKDILNNYIFGYQAGPKDMPFIIDAKEKGNLIRFVNHSFYPNISSKWVIKNNLTSIVLITNKLIKKHTQLTYDYGPYYWRSRSYPLSL